MAVLELIMTEFGGRAIPYVDVKDVSTTPIQIVKRNPNRAGLLIQNIGSYNVYIGLKPDVSPTNGLLLMSNGGSLSVYWKEDGYLVTEEYWAVAPASTRLYIQELIIVSEK